LIKIVVTDVAFVQENFINRIALIRFVKAFVTDGESAILILKNRCSSSRNIGIVRTSESAKRGRVVEHAGIV
jgi:hypothetical protein